jgi:acetylornithine deacetylase/succinyl-diaminopimelate desuccinylase-like protein
MSKDAEDPTGEVTELLQTMIRNACVNDGSDDSGHEVRNADVLESYLEGSGVDIEEYEPHPGRRSLVARIEGTDPTAPTLLLMGHTDVVPVTPENWSRDPFGGELVEGEVWGRGAVDMLNLTASMAVATRRLALQGWRPRGTLIYFAVADEEANGVHGAAHMVAHEADAVRADYVLTENGGIPLPGGDGERLPVLVAEKGTMWTTLRIRGTAGHASAPYRTDNALVTAAEVVRRIDAYRPATMIGNVWRGFVEGMGWPDELAQPLLSADDLPGLCEMLPVGLARQAHACTHTTFAPTVVHGGTKTNVIPDSVDLDIDVRTLPGQTGDDVRRMLDEVLGDLADKVEVVRAVDDPSTASPVDTPLWDTLSRAARRFRPDARTVPFMTAGATDARFFRRFGAVAYGFGLYDENLSFEDFSARFHGDDERIDVNSLRLTTQLWDVVAHDLLD